MILPYYESTDTVRSILNEVSIPARKHEKEGSLLIIDSLKAYFGSDIDLPSFVKRLVKYATEKEDSRKNGVSVIADMGSFYLTGQTDKVVDYERSLPSKFDINMKGFCCYHQKDFNRLTEHQKQILTKGHGKNLVALECG